MTRSELIARLQAHASDLRMRGIASLILIGAGQASEIDSDQTLEFLVEPGEPLSYDQWRSLRADLAELLGCPVDLTVVDSGDERVQDFLDPAALRIL